MVYGHGRECLCFFCFVISLSCAEFSYLWFTQLLPLYVVEKLGNIPGLSGLFVSGIFSGSLSTMSSALNSLAAVTLQDYILVGHYQIHSGFHRKFCIF